MPVARGTLMRQSTEGYTTMATENRGPSAHVWIWEGSETVGLPDFVPGPGVYDEFPDPKAPRRRTRRAAAILAAVGSLLTGCGAVAVAQAAPSYVQSCTDPGRSWCGGDTFSVIRYVPDGHYRDDGSIPLVTNVRAW